RYPLISVGWLNHDTPLIALDTTERSTGCPNLMELGATAMIFMPIGFATENHETLLDVEHIIGALRRKRPDITYVQMPCVNDHPDFLQMAADWANPQIEALLGETALAINPSLAATQAQQVQGHSHSHDHDHNHDHHHDGHHHHDH
ncbi:MAG: ferrochelatase, partial [Oscillatoriales cyanobacterium SM2_3_0]|nr:ferrochelatase [Oscillatoriales cyanobacterium SM2_3_0]